MERNKIRVYDSISDLQNVGGADKDAVLVTDSSGGIFAWDAASSAAGNGDTVVAVTGYSGNGRWLRKTRLSNLSQIEITGSTVDLALGTDFWKEITANLTLALSNASDGKKASISIRNTGASPATVDITSVPFPDGATNEIPAGGRAHISLQQINGIMDASIVIYSPTTA